MGRPSSRPTRTASTPSPPWVSTRCSWCESVPITATTSPPSVNGHQDLPTLGQMISPGTAMCLPRYGHEIPHLLTSDSVGQGLHPLAARSVLETDRLARGLDDVSMVQQSVDESGSQARRHELIEPGGMEVRGQRDRPPLVGGIDEPIEAFGCFFGDGKETDVVDDDDVGPEHRHEGFHDGVVDPVSSHQAAEILDREPGHRLLGVEGEVAEGLEQVALACPRWTTDHEVLVALHPLEGAEGLLGGWCDRTAGGFPGGEGLAGREPGPSPPVLGHRAIPALDLGLEKDTESLGRVPALGLG